MKVNLEDLAVKDGQLLLKQESEWVNGWMTVDIKKQEPSCKFKGKPMSIELWFQIISFFKWTQEKFKSESQIRLYYEKEKKIWNAFPYPQTPSGMTTNDESSQEIRSKFPEPWQYFGTAHHHCTAGAFQSGTDEANEKNQDGFHYTIGHLDKPNLDYHGRFSWGGSLFQTDLFQWVQLPDWASEIPVQIRSNSLYDYLLCSNVATKKEYNFPEEWKSSIKKPVQKTWTGNAFYGTGPYNPTLFPTENTYSRGGPTVYANSPTTDEEKEAEEEEKITLAEQSICQEVDEILWQAGMDADTAYKLLSKPQDEMSTAETIDYNALKDSLMSFEMHPASFKRKVEFLFEFDA